MEYRKDKPKSQRNFPVCQNITYFEFSSSVILRKLEYYREGESEKHLRDISSILAFSSDEIDFKMLEAHINKRTLEKEWKAAKDFEV